MCLFLTKRISCLQHEALDDAVEDDTVVVTVLRMAREVLNCPWAFVGKELESDVALCRVKHCRAGEDDD